MATEMRRLTIANVIDENGIKLPCLDASFASGLKALDCDVEIGVGPFISRESDMPETLLSSYKRLAVVASFIRERGEGNCLMTEVLLFPPQHMEAVASFIRGWMMSRRLSMLSNTV